MSDLEKVREALEFLERECQLFENSSSKQVEKVANEALPLLESAIAEEKRLQKQVTEMSLLLAMAARRLPIDNPLKARIFRYRVDNNLHNRFIRNGESVELQDDKIAKQALEGK